MKTASAALPGMLSARGTLLVDSRLTEQAADPLHYTAFFIRDASGRYLVVNQSLVERLPRRHPASIGLSRGSDRSFSTGLGRLAGCKVCDRFWCRRKAGMEMGEEDRALLDQS